MRGSKRKVPTSETILSLARWATLLGMVHDVFLVFTGAQMEGQALLQGALFCPIAVCFS